MTFSNVKLVFGRELRDQLRDRRTLFVIAVLPILLYPLLGLSLFQVSQFMQEQSTRVLVVGAEKISGSPSLFDKEHFSGHLFGNPDSARLLEIHMASRKLATAADPDDLRAAARERVLAGEYDAAVYFPPNFCKQLDAFREMIQKRAVGGKEKQPAVRPQVPSPEIIYNTAKDKSQIAFIRISDVLRRWTDQIGDENLAVSGVPKVAVKPFFVDASDVADRRQQESSMWSKILPILLLIWALTGAFYPAIDLCAGEKERGTLETLLCSPAQRSEIAVGKLLTIMVFSIASAMLNVISVGITGWMAADHLPGFGVPPIGALLAITAALVPISALFSALCLALAAFARSSKEGQYYLMPLLVVTLPLVILPMSPGVELNLGNSLIPITGVVLLLRCVMEGNYWQALQFSPAVAGITLMACLVSIRWAIDQFNSESVLFRESERLDLRLWLRRMYAERLPTPSATAAVCCGILILVVHFFTSFSQTIPDGFAGLVRSVLTTQFAVVLAPTILLTLLLARSPRKTLLLKLPPRASLVGAALLAIALHPASCLLQVLVQRLYPVGESIRPALEKMQEMFRQADFWPLVLLIAVVPALCEELAFRGFILSGFSRAGYKWRAVIYSALLFGLTHGILQQSLIASLLGVVLGFLAMQSGSILPGMVFHAMHNGLAVANSRVTPEMISAHPVVREFVTAGEGGGCRFDWIVVVVGSLSAVLLLSWFSRINGGKSSAERPDSSVEHPEHAQLPLETACS